jgi:hypothetical protein
MTAARIELIEPDPWLAASFLKQACQFEASSAGLPPESRQVLLHAAVIAACDAVLAINGLRLKGSEGGHRLRIHTTRDLLGGDEHELFDLLDEARELRNHVSYAAALAVPADVEQTATAVVKLLALVDAHVSPHLPDWR